MVTRAFGTLVTCGHVIIVNLALTFPQMPALPESWGDGGSLLAALTRRCSAFVAVSGVTGIFFFAYLLPGNLRGAFRIAWW